MQTAQLPEVTEFKYLGSTIQKDGGTEAEVNCRIQSGWKNWKKMSGVLMVMQPAMLYAMETVPVTCSQVKKLQVVEMKMCRWACGFTGMDHISNKDIMDKVEVEAISVRCQKSQFRWYAHVKRREWQKCVQTHTGGDATSKEKERQAKIEMDGLRKKLYENRWCDRE